MTSTPVKDVGSVFSSLNGAVGSSAKTVTGNGFQTMLNGHTGRDGAGNRTGSFQPENSQTAVKKTPGESLKAKDAHQARMADQQAVEDESAVQEVEEIPAEKLEEVMAVLGTAVIDLMQQIADTFGISVEELESAMQELGMDSLDVLDQENLGALILELGGEQDVYALVTNGELYEDYQKLMESLEELLQEAGEELDISPEQLQDAMQPAIQKAIQPEVVEEDAPREIPVEVVRETGDELQAKPGTEKPAETGEAQEPEQTEPLVTATEDNRSAEEKNSRPDTESGKSQSEQSRSEQAKNEQVRNGQVRSEHSHHAAHSFRTEQFQSQFSTQVQQPASADVWRADTQDIMRQIMDYMRIQVKPETSSLEMQLHPENLGSLHIQIASKGGVVTANFIAQNEAVKAALESQMVQLRENFEEQGVKVEAIEVTVQSHAFERNLDQGRGQNGAQEQNPASRRTRTRRINLNDSLETENLAEEDALAAEMMAASGSQVDYTA